MAKAFAPPCPKDSHMTDPRHPKFVAGCLTLFLSCALAGTAAAEPPQVRVEPAGTLRDGTPVDQYTLTNSNHVEVHVLTYGATLTAVIVPDRRGQCRNVTLYLDRLEDYEAGHPLFGSIVGRYANRIAGAAFSIDGQQFELTRNMGADHIHGGNNGFHKLVWAARPVQLADRAGVELSHASPDGHEGYPGTLRVRIQYLLTADNSLVMEYWAKTDKPTHLNLTNHAYWNLCGAGAGDVLSHRLTIHADKVVVADSKRFPTGEIRSVADTPFDFRTPHLVGERIAQAVDENYDDCYVLSAESRREPALAARVVDPESGRGMEVFTTQPGVQLYTAKGLGNQLRAADGPYGPYHGLCLETQHFPDSPNHPAFPTTLLRPGEEFHQVTIHRFFTD
jgi:aldose 1-epimerase